MPDVTKVEQIMVAVETMLGEVGVAAGYNYDYVAVSRWARLIDHVDEFPVLFCPAGDEPGEIQVQGQKRVQQIPVWGYHNLQAEVGTQVNKMRQDIERKLLTPVDGLLLGLGFVTLMEIHEVNTFQHHAKQAEMVRVAIDITYEYTHGNP